MLTSWLDPPAYKIPISALFFLTTAYVLPTQPAQCRNGKTISIFSYKHCCLKAIQECGFKRSSTFQCSTTPVFECPFVDSKRSIDASLLWKRLHQICSTVTIQWQRRASKGVPKKLIRHVPATIIRLSTHHKPRVLPVLVRMPRDIYVELDSYSINAITNESDG